MFEANASDIGGLIYAVFLLKFADFSNTKRCLCVWNES